MDLNSTNVTLTFALDRTVAPTLVQILNEADSDIILNGTINNPIGSTVIHNSGGNITAARARGVAETRAPAAFPSSARPSSTSGPRRAASAALHPASTST